MSDLIERLRVAVRNSKATIFGEQISATLGSEAAAALEDLAARLRIETKRADDAEARNDFLITELDILREKARQS